MRADKKPITSAEVTPEMIEAGCAVLWDALGATELGPTGAEILAERVLTAGLSAFRLHSLKMTKL